VDKSARQVRLSIDLLDPHNSTERLEFSHLSFLTGAGDTQFFHLSFLTGAGHTKKAK